MSHVVVAQSEMNGSSHRVDVCELLRTPSAYDGKAVQIRGKLKFDFEGKEVDDSACGLALSHTAIWWTYGGTPPFSQEARRNRISESARPVLRDAQFIEYNERIQAHRNKLLDGEMCRTHKTCGYYDVLATFTGRFFASPMIPRQLSGYGHMGCCHLFVVEQISEVDARRTAVPDDALRFTCTSSSWQSPYPKTVFTNWGDRITTNREFLRDQLQSHGDEALLDVLGSESGWDLLGLAGYLQLTSPDLQTTYTAHLPARPKAKKPKKHQPPPPDVPMLANINRERCEPLMN